MVSVLKATGLIPLFLSQLALAARSNSRVKSADEGAKNPSRIISASGNSFTDSTGRSRIFHGTNVVYKAAPWHPDIADSAVPQWSFNKKDIEILKTQGVNAVRLGVMWPGVEPTKGKYSEAYLDVMKTIVQRCSDAGIYVLLDFHQDFLSEKFCGEGIPLWAVSYNSSYLSFPARPMNFNECHHYDANGIPDDSCCPNFGEGQLAFASASAYNDLFTNVNGLRDSLAGYWKKVAETFKTFDNILGYDLMNEPFGGDIYDNPALAVPGNADLHNLQPFYDALAESIRSVDPNGLIFFDSVTNDNQIPIGFTAVPGGSKYPSSKSVHSYHYYQGINIVSFEQHVEARNKDIARLKCGAMLTEFEMGNGHEVEIKQTMQFADSQLLSYTGWEYTDYIKKTGTNNGLRDPDSGEVRSTMAILVSRPYASAVPGTIQSMKFDDNTGTFTLQFKWNSRATDKDTDIRTNIVLQYPNGYSLAVTGGAFTSSDDSVSFIHVTPTENILNDALITVTITKK